MSVTEPASVLSSLSSSSELVRHPVQELSGAIQLGKKSNLKNVDDSEKEQ